MKRFLLFITAMVLGLLHPLTTSAARSAANPQKAEAQAPSFYAVTAAPTVGISKFTADSDPLSLTEVFSDNEIGYITERVVAAYGNGKLFFYQPRINNYNEVWKLRFVSYKLDGDTWAFDNAVELAPSYYFPHFLNYDPQTSTLYGLKNTMNGCEVYVVDQQTGDQTLVRTLPSLYNMVVTDAYGVTYATDYDGMLYNINLATGETKQIGATGIHSDDIMVGIVDPVTGRLYQNLSKSGNYTLYELSKTTGEATKVGAFPAGTNVRGLAPVAATTPGVTQQAPDACTDINVEYDVPGATSAIIRATAPTMSFDKVTPLTGKVSVKFYVDEEEAPFRTVDNVSAGQTVNVGYEFNTSGIHKIKVVAANSVGEGPARTISTYAGYDTPKAPNNISLTIAADGNYNLTWEAPTEGINGGAVNKNQLTYVITQYPEGKEVGQTKKLAFNGTVTSHSFSDYYFGVKAVVNGKTGEEGLSNHATHGDFADIPYYDDFSNTDTHGTYTIVNTRDDATWEFKNSNIGGMAAIYDGSQCNNVADDYLILPPMNISKGTEYTITFKVASAFNQDYGNNLDLLLVKSNTDPANGKTKIGSFDNIPDYTEGLSEKTFTYTATEDGTAFFAFFCRSAAKRKVTLYDIQILGSNFENAPADVENLEAVAGEMGEHTVAISFVAPTKDAKGNALTDNLTIKVFRDNEKTPVKTFTSIQPGESCNFTDNTVGAGRHTYTVITVNKKGASEGAYTTAFVGQGVPSAPTNFKITEDDDAFILSWTEPTTSSDGHYIDFSKLTYAIYYQYGLMENPQLLDGEVSGNELRVPKAMFDDYASAHQILITFIIMAQTEGGISPIQMIDVLYGKAYTLPFNESFEGGFTSTEPWGIVEVSDKYVSCWTMITGTSSKKPMDVYPQDDDNGMAMFYQNSEDAYEARLISPQVDITGANNPYLSFYVYHYNSASATDNTIQIELQYDKTYDYVAIGEPIKVFGESGWEEHRIDLSNAKDKKFRVAFHATADKQAPIFIDNMTVDGGTETAISSLSDSDSSVKTLDGAILINADNAKYSVCNAAGATVAAGTVTGQKAVRLAPGLYIVHVAGKTVKCTVK